MFPYFGLLLAVLGLGFGLVAIGEEKNSTKYALVFSGVAIFFALALLYQAITSGKVVQNELYASYIPSLAVGINFNLTPINLALIIMAALVAFVTILSGNVEKEREKTANALILLFEFAAIGLFAAANLFIFFIFWDIGVVALFFMLYLLGSANRKRAAMKFLAYEIFASMFLLLAIMLIYFYTPVGSFNIDYIISHVTQIPPMLQFIVFACFFIAFAVNMPVFPVHLWLPDAHTEASTQGSMLLSGILTKFGGYGMILTFLMFPLSSYFSKFTALLAGFSAIYIAFGMMKQHDIKRIIAYTTIVEMSIILLGIATISNIGIAGATYAMLAHGFTISMLFLAAGSIGFMFAERDIKVLKGVVKHSASTAYTLLVGIFATTGVPLSAAFVGDVLIFYAAVKAFAIAGIVPIISLLLLGAFLYYMINKSILSTKESSPGVDFIQDTQRAGYALLLFLIILLGIFPFIFLQFFAL